jgi:hypothetical protein
MIFVVTLIVIPYVIDYSVKQWIKDRGNHQVTVEDVDFNPFTGSLAIYELQAELENNTPLAIDVLRLDMVLHKLFSKQIVIEGITIEGINLEVNQDDRGNLQIGGIQMGGNTESANGGEPEVAWGFAIDSLELKDVNIDYRAPDIESQLQLEVLKLTDLASFKPEQQASLVLNGSIDGAELHIDGKLRLFEIKRGFNGGIVFSGLQLGKYASLLPEGINKLTGTVNIDTQLDIHYSAGDALTARQDGELKLDALDIAGKDGQVFQQGQAAWSGVSSMHWPVDTSASSTLTLTGDLLLDQGSYASGEMLTIAQGRLKWSGETSVTLPADKPASISSKGKLTSGQFRLSAKDRDTNVDYENLDWSGEVKFSTAGDAKEQKLTGQLTIDALRATSPTDNITLALLDKLVVTGVNADMPRGLSVNKVEFNGLTVGKQGIDADAVKDNKAVSAVRYGQLVLDGLQYGNDKGLSIDTIRQIDVLQTVRKTSEGEWNMIRIVNLMKKTAGNKKAIDKPAKDKAMPVRVGSILVEGDSRLVFEDYQVKPAFRQEIRFNKGSLKNLDTAKPGQQSPIEIEGIIGKRSKLNLSGVMSPFANQLTADLKGEISGLPLPPLSTYSEQMLGYTIQSGELDADINFKASTGKLDGKNTLNLHQLEVKPLPPEEMKKLKSKLEVPLETGLAVLRDKHNNIKLELPISGDVENFKVDPSDIINQVLGKAMKQAAKSYVTYALFPYGTLLAVVEVAGEKAMQINLDPIEYEAGSSSLTAKHKEYLAKVAKILEERPEIHVKLCGVANEQDRQNMAQQALPAGQKTEKSPDNKPAEPMITDGQLLVLAEVRAEGIEAHLEDVYKTKPNRLISCQARIMDETDKGQPRTELSLR